MSTQQTRSFGTPTPDKEPAPAESSGAPAPPAMTSRVDPGDVLGGKYRVERVMATGGMGVVVAARHLQLEERVAIKLLRDEILGDADAVARFAREARTAIKIKSEHIARVLDVGALDNGAPYMVMEYLEGEDLATVVRSRGALAIAQAVEFVLQACEAISEAHALGVVHRDLKPANLFVTRRADGILAVKVLDFGISKPARGAAGAGTSVTRRSVAVGSPSYMAPEQLASPAEVDARADIWALGITSFELLTGEVPFKADATPVMCGKILRDPPPPLRSVRPNAPAGLEVVLDKCLAKDPADRYQDVGELARALAPFAPERARASVQRICRTVEAAEIASKPAGRASKPGARAEGTHPTRVIWDQSPSGTTPKRKLASGLTLAAVVVVLGIAGVFAWRAMAERAAPTPGPVTRESIAEPAPPIVAPASAAAPAVDRDAVSMGDAPAPPAKAIPINKHGPRKPNGKSNAPAPPRPNAPGVFETRD